MDNRLYRSLVRLGAVKGHDEVSLLKAGTQGERKNKRALQRIHQRMSCDIYYFINESESHRLFLRFL